MPITDWQAVPLATTGDMWTAAQHNTYIRQNQQVLRDALALGHGQGSNVDMVDGRHGAEYMQIDMPRTVIAATDGWHILAHTTAPQSIGYFVLMSDTEYWAGLVTPNRIHEIRKAPPGPGPALRVAYDGVGEYRFEAHFKAGETWYVAQGSWSPGATQWARWGDGPDTVDTDTTVSVIDGAVAGNGSWRLERAMSGTGTIGWMTPAQKQATFIDGGHSGLLGYNFSNFLDGNTGNYGGYIDGPGSTGCVSGYVVFDAQQTIVLDAIRSYVTGERASMRIDVSNDGTNWNYLGTVGAGTGWRQLSFTARSARYWKVTWCGFGYGNSYYHEVDFRIAASIIMRGVPVGSLVKLLNGTGNVLESRRQTSWERDAPLMFSTVASNVAKVAITRPDGASSWLSWPVWAIDGWDPGGYQVLTLYPLSP